MRALKPEDYLFVPGPLAIELPQVQALEKIAQWVLDPTQQEKIEYIVDDQKGLLIKLPDEKPQDFATVCDGPHLQHLDSKICDKLLNSYVIFIEKNFIKLYEDDYDYDEKEFSHLQTRIKSGCPGLTHIAHKYAFHDYSFQATELNAILRRDKEKLAKLSQREFHELICTILVAAHGLATYQSNIAMTDSYRILCWKEQQFPLEFKLQDFFIRDAGFGSVSQGAPLYQRAAKEDNAIKVLIKYAALPSGDFNDVAKHQQYKEGAIAPGSLLRFRQIWQVDSYICLEGSVVQTITPPPQPNIAVAGIFINWAKKNFHVGKNALYRDMSCSSGLLKIEGKIIYLEGHPTNKQNHSTPHMIRKMWMRVIANEFLAVNIKDLRDREIYQYILHQSSPSLSAEVDIFTAARACGREGEENSISNRKKYQEYKHITRERFQTFFKEQSEREQSGVAAFEEFFQRHFPEEKSPSIPCPSRAERFAMYLSILSDNDEDNQDSEKTEIFYRWRRCFSYLGYLAHMMDTLRCFFNESEDDTECHTARIFKQSAFFFEQLTEQGQGTELDMLWHYAGGCLIATGNRIRGDHILPKRSYTHEFVECYDLETCIAKLKTVGRPIFGVAPLAPEELIAKRQQFARHLLLLEKLPEEKDENVPLFVKLLRENDYIRLKTYALSIGRKWDPKISPDENVIQLLTVTISDAKLVTFAHKKLALKSITEETNCEIIGLAVQFCQQHGSKEELFKIVFDNDFIKLHHDIYGQKKNKPKSLQILLDYLINNTSITPCDISLTYKFLLKLLNLLGEKKWGKNPGKMDQETEAFQVQFIHWLLPNLDKIIKNTSVEEEKETPISPVKKYLLLIREFEFKDKIDQIIDLISSYIISNPQDIIDLLKNNPYRKWMDIDLVEKILEKESTQQQLVKVIATPKILFTVLKELPEESWSLILCRLEQHLSTIFQDVVRETDIPPPMRPALSRFLASKREDIVSRVSTPAFFSIIQNNDDYQIQYAENFKALIETPVDNYFPK